MRVFLKPFRNEGWAGTVVSTRNVFYFFKSKPAFAASATMGSWQSPSSINKWAAESLPQPLLAGEDAGQRGESWNKIILLLQYLSVQKEEILILAAAHMLTSTLQGSLDLNARHGHPVPLQKGLLVTSNMCFWFQLKHIYCLATQNNGKQGVRGTWAPVCSVIYSASQRCKSVLKHTLLGEY